MHKLKILSILFSVSILFGCENESIRREYARVETSFVEQNYSTAKVGATIISAGNYPIVEAGFVWGISKDLDISKDKVWSIQSSQINESDWFYDADYLLDPDKQVFFRAFVVDENGTIIYGNFISTYSLYKDCVPGLFNPAEDGLVAYYPLNGNGDDFSSYSNNGRTGFDPDPTTDKNGCDNGAIKFTFKSNHYELRNGKEYDLLNYEDFTIAFWMKAEPHSTNGQVIYRKKTSEKHYYSIQYLENDSLEFWTNGQSLKIAVSKGLWRHITFVYQDKLLKVYLDGVLKGKKNILMPNNTCRLSTWQCSKANIGYYDESFAGSLDELRIYNRGLSENEVILLGKN